MTRPLEIYMVIAMNHGPSPFTRRDIVTVIARGHRVSLLPTKAHSGRPVPDGARVALPRYSHRMLWAAAGLCRVLTTGAGRALAREAVLSGQASSLLNACAYFARLPRPDLVYAVFGDRKLFTGYYLSLLWGCPLTVTIHAYELHTNPNPAVFGKALARCSTVMTVTEFNRTLLEERWGVEPAKIEVVRVSVDPTLFDDRGRFVILIVGGVSYRKGHETLFAALRLLDDQDIEVWVVGGPQGSFPADPAQLARRHGVDGQCVQFGWLGEEAVAALMRRADVLCAPSRVDPDGNMEGFPTVLAEAMHSGLPVITTRHAEIPVVVPSIVVDEDSPEQLAAAIRAYRDDPGARAGDAAANLRLASRLFVGQPGQDLLRVLERVGADG